MLNIFDWLRGRSQVGRTATELYGSIVTQARQPVFYRDFHVPDVAEKRYELIVLHVVMVLERLRALGDDGMVLAQAVVEAFVRDLDGSIREMAVSDTKVPAKVKKAAGGLYDRDALYQQAFKNEDGVGKPADGADDGMTLEGLLCELVLGNEQSKAQALLRYTQAARRNLANWQLGDGPGQLVFPKPEVHLGDFI